MIIAFDVQYIACFFSLMQTLLPKPEQREKLQKDFGSFFDFALDYSKKIDSIGVDKMSDKLFIIESKNAITAKAFKILNKYNELFDFLLNPQDQAPCSSSKPKKKTEKFEQRKETAKIVPDAKKPEFDAKLDTEKLDTSTLEISKLDSKYSDNSQFKNNDQVQNDEDETKLTLQEVCSSSALHKESSNSLWQGHTDNDTSELLLTEEQIGFSDDEDELSFDPKEEHEKYQKCKSERTTTATTTNAILQKVIDPNKIQWHENLNNINDLDSFNHHIRKGQKLNIIKSYNMVHNIYCLSIYNFYKGNAILNYGFHGPHGSSKKNEKFNSFQLALKYMIKDLSESK